MSLSGIGFSITSQKRYVSYEKKRIYEFIVDETLIKVGGEFVWLWIASEPTDKTILGIHISYERSMLIAEHFILSLVKKYGKHPVFQLMVVHGIHKPVDS